MHRLNDVGQDRSRRLPSKRPRYGGLERCTFAESVIGEFREEPQSMTAQQREVQRESLITETFLDLARSLTEDCNLSEQLTRITHRCVDLCRVDSAGIVLSDIDDSLGVVALSDEKARPLLLTHIQSPETAGHRSYSFPVQGHGSIIGSLCLFGNPACFLSEADLDLAQTLADFAGITVRHAQGVQSAQQRERQLQQALTSRVVIEQAKGMLAVQGAIDLDTAFDMLRTHARNTNSQLSVIARHIIEGTLAMNQICKPAV
jgi:GAF domain-containing protein